MLNPHFLIRKMTVQDIDQIMDIEKEVFTLPWSRESYLGELKNKFATYLICDSEGEVAGYAGIWVVFEDAHITNIAVAQRFQGMGMGNTLMQEVEKVARDKKARRILLEVRPSNERAINMYTNLGYVATSLRKGYYPDNCEDAIIMTKLLL
ncbi:MAG: ribosomal protein S18-alanine N-acetyltransferase [Syntrophomonadaceae bacterium]|nr:ribosomal protein S18-alanine N-acetyltransferase [Syntrophomonadaceae bacterium]MDD3889426.1 ribosomal protein S18-alanine N-acetyltransferase [Syntrophomonadaceae bacterium]MDD4548394.1 ribosomal protein S18-alanine N-acetyltransferase [Syntrophomonadaceae bacterium]